MGRLIKATKEETQERFKNGLILSGIRRPKPSDSASKKPTGKPPAMDQPSSK